MNYLAIDTSRSSLTVAVGGKKSAVSFLPDCALNHSVVLMDEIGRGVSSYDMVGEYTGAHRKQLSVLCSPRESILIKRRLAELDPKAFVSVMQVNTVWGYGKGFTDIEDEK